MFAFIKPFEAKFAALFSSPAAKAVESAVADNIGPVTSGLIELMALLGVRVGPHATAIIKDVIVASTTTLSSENKALAVANGVHQIGLDTGSQLIVNNAAAITKVAYLIASTEGLLGSPAPVAVPAALPPTNVAVAYQQSTASPAPVASAVASTFQGSPAPLPASALDAVGAGSAQAGGVLSQITGVPRAPVTPNAPGNLVAGG